MRASLIWFVPIAIAVLIATPLHAQAPAPPGANQARIAAITISGKTQLPSDQIVAASGLKVGDLVGVQQIQGATNRLSELGVFMAVNYRFTSKGDSINLEFQVQDAPSVPVGFDNFPWFSDEELAAAIRNEVGLFAGTAPTSGTMLDAITAAIGRLLAAHKIEGAVTHQLVLQPVGDGMMMQFRLENSAIVVKSLTFGDAVATSSERLKDRIPDIQGHPYSRFAIDLFEHEQILPIYQSTGHFEIKFGPSQPKISGEDSDPAKQTIDLVIPISPGPVYTWNGANWDGNKVYPAAKLDTVVGIQAGEVADGGKIDIAWQHVLLEYGRLGYLDTTVFPQPMVDEAAHRVSYRVSINEGEQYHMGELVITGLSPDAQALLLRSWQIPHGQIFDNAYYQSLLKVLVKPSVEIFGDHPVHYTEFGHFLRPDTSKHIVDVLLDFK